jgi:hypothetical protein
MANKKFSEFELKTTTSNVSHVVGYDGTENVRITPANFVTTGGTGVFLPLAGGLMVGNTTHNDNVKSIYGSPGNDLEIYHDGSNSYISDTGTGTLRFQSNGGAIDFYKDSTEFLARFKTDSGIELYYDSALKFATTTTGISVLSDTATTLLINADTHSASVQSTAKLQLGFAHSGSPQAFGHIVLQETANNSFDGTLIFSAPQNNGSGGSVTVDCLNIKGSDKSATFAGLITLPDNKEIKGTTFYSSYLKFAANTELSANDNIIFNANGVEKMRLGTSGNLGIGTTTPDRPLTVEGGNTIVAKFKSQSTSSFIQLSNTVSTADQIRIGTASNDLTFSTNYLERMRVDSLGNLGIGTSTPSLFNYSNLVVEGGSGAGITISDNTGSGTPSLSFAASSSFDGKGTISYDMTASSLTFANLGSERMRLDSSGNVGVGTATPNIYNLTDATNILSVQATGTNKGGIIDISGNGTGYSGINIGNETIRRAGIYSLNGSDLSFYTNPTDSGTALTERMRIDSNGSIGFGTSSATPTIDSLFIESVDNYALYSGSDGTGTSNHMVFGNANSWVGTITTNGSATAYNTSSDYRLKEDLQDFKGLEMVSKIPVYDYKWKADESRSYGVMAHELQEVLPDAVTGEKDAEEMQGVDYSKIVPLLVKSIQELSAKLESLECQCKKK